MITPSFGLTATERVLPKLALDFTTVSLDSRITFTRTTGASNPATYVGSNGYITSASNNQPRFDYDPVTLVCKGLLIEESRQNAWVYSENFSGWTPQPGVALEYDQTTSPANTLTADKATKTGAVTFQSINKNVTVTNTTSYVFTVFLKNINAAQTRVRFICGTSDVNVFVDWSNPSATSTNYGNGWYRVSVPFTSASTTGSPYIYPAGSGTAEGAIYVWGAQLEVGAFATSYIPTTSAALTRNADVAVMTGANFSSWWQATIGGVTASALPSTVSGVRPLIQFDDTTANNIIALRGNTTNPELYVKATTDQAQIDAGTIAANTLYKLTGAWNTNNCAAAINGSAVVTDTSATIPTATQARLGCDGTNYLNGQLQTIRYWPQRIIDAEVQAFSK